MYTNDQQECYILDIKVFNPNALSYRNSSLSLLYHRLKREQQKKYEQHIHEVKMGCFTPLVFPLLKECTLFVTSLNFK